MAPLPDIAPADLMHVIEAQYDLRISALPTSLTPGVHSRAWFVPSDQGQWVAKLSDPSSDPLAKLERQIQLTTYLHRHGIQTPQIRPLRNGNHIATLTLNHDDYPLHLMKYERLSRIDPTQATAATLVSVGQHVAHFHQVLGHYPGRAAYIRDRQKSVNEWGQRDHGLEPAVTALPTFVQLSRAEQVWLWTVEHAAQAFVLRYFPDPAGLTLALLHGDLNFEHIQLLADGSPYLFDFGDMCWGPLAHEFAVFFCNLFFAGDLSFAQWQTVQRHLLNGYTSVTPLQPGDRAAIPALAVNRILAVVQYSIELATAGRIVLNWDFIKQAYRLAAYLVNEGE